MSVLDDARGWRDADPDARTQATLDALIDAADSGDATALAELEDAFSGTLSFGTAGLRGRIGPGPNRMNIVTVARAAGGLAEYIKRTGHGAVIIGYDARTDSDLFANATAQILSGAGLPAMVLPQHLPTPVLAFAIRYFGCAAGVMVTASHNPPQDNGYKVYLGDGRQIVPPADAEIATAIAHVTELGPVAGLPHGDDWITLGDEVLDDYVRKAVALVEPGPPLDVRIAYTAMHGVGGQVMLRVLEEVGFPKPVVVEQQFAPDPQFPTVSFPNPEEPGAMDLALATAAENDCDLILANDPDADRCAVGVPTADGWRMLSGDEVGWLLGWWIAVGNRRFSRRGVFAQSIVSGTMLECIAEDAGLDYEQTLTGFKWIARVPDLMFGYEEALGYCVDPNGVRDKDGITAGLMIAEMAARLKDKGRTLQDILDELAMRHGVHATSQVSVRVQDLARIGEVMSQLRATPPATVGGVEVVTLEDLEQGAGGLPPTDGLRFTLADRSRVIVRPSGTEPKVKCYLQAVVDVTNRGLDPARAEAQHRLDAMSADVRRWLA